MTPRTALAADIAHDLGLTRHLLARLPDESLSWRPHARAFSLAGLATHIVRLPHWGAQILEQDGYDLERAGTGHRAPCQARSEVLEVFDRHVAEWTHAFASTPDDRLAASWKLHRAGVVLESLTRLAAVERYLHHHLIHHRGQLSVYLRQLDISLPPLYGPTADDNP